MDIFPFIIAIVAISGILAPLAKGIGRRIAKSGGDPIELQRVQSLLEQSELRLQDAERRLQLAEERLDFQEKLLSSRPAVRSNE